MKFDDKVKALLDYNNTTRHRLEEICEPLKAFNISNFEYGRVSRDKKLFRIGTHEQYTELYFQHKVYNLTSRYWSNPSLKEKRALYVPWDSYPAEVNKIRMSAGIGNGISFYHLKKDYVEGWSFGGTMADTQLHQFYLNNLDVFHKFFLYFKSVAKELITVSDPSKMIDVECEDNEGYPYLGVHENVKEFNKKILTNTLYLSTLQRDFSVSARELECLVYKGQGLTAKEIARKCGLSPRTVETYLTKVTIKSGLNVCQLLTLFKEEGVL